MGLHDGHFPNHLIEDRTLTSAPVLSECQSDSSDDNIHELATVGRARTVNYVKFFNMIGIIIAVLLSPFTSGASTGHDGRPYVDGSISTAVVFAWLTPMIFVIYSIYAGIQLQNESAHFTVWGISMLLFGLGLVATVILSIFMYKGRNYVIMQPGCTKDPTMKLKLIFLWLFGFLVILQSTIYVANDIECIFSGYTSRMWESFQIMSSLIIIIFISFQLGFISYFKSISIPRTMLTNYCVILIVLANVSTWYFTTVECIYAIGNNISYDLSRSQNGSLTRNETLCFYSSPIHRLSGTLNPFIMPAKLQFGLLASYILIQITKKRKTTATCSHTDNSDEECSNHEVFSSSNQEANDSSVRSKQIIVLLICIVINIPYLLLEMMDRFVKSTPSDLIPQFSTIYRLIYKLLTMILIYLGFNSFLKRSDIVRKEINIQGRELLVLISTAGYVGFESTQLLASLFCKAKPYNYELHLTREVMALWCALVQCAFILKAGKYKCSNRSIVPYVCLILAICNLTHWVSVTTKSLKLYMNREITQSCMNSKTVKILLKVLFQFLSNYRLVSFIELYNLYKIRS